MLAEISDKVPSVARLLCLHSAAAVVAVLISLPAERRAVLIVLVPLTLAWAALFIFLAFDRSGPLGAAILEEMGPSYIIAQGVAALVPAVGVAVRLLVR